MDDVVLFWMTGCATCRACRDFLMDEAVDFESVNISAGERAHERWVQAGKPHVPAVSVGGRATSLLHYSQLAPLVGRQLPPQRDTSRLAWDLLRIVEDWMAVVPTIDWDTLLAPTPVGDCSPAMFVTNAFPPIGLLASAWEDGVFPWPGDHEVLLANDRRVALGFTDHLAVAEYMRDCTRPFRDLVLDVFADEAPPERMVTTPDRGDVPFTVLLASQRWHAVFHLYQVVVFMQQRGLEPPPLSSFTAMPDLDLPADPFTP